MNGISKLKHKWAMTVEIDGIVEVDTPKVDDWTDSIQKKKEVGANIILGKSFFWAVWEDDVQGGDRNDEVATRLCNATTHVWLQIEMVAAAR